jgi:glycerol-3-phosphate acyltransferase PlsY
VPVLASSSLPVAVLLVVAGYVVGMFPSAQLAGRWRGVDPTRSGSRNPGTTNVLRTAGRRAAVLTLVGDLAKGAVPSGVGWAVGGHGLGVACGVAAVVGHVAPVTRRFHGGKGVATGMGMVSVLFPVPALLAVTVFAVVFALGRIASAASLAGVATALVAVAATGDSLPELLALVFCLSLIVARHAENIQRLLHGEEKRTSGLRRSTPRGGDAPLG